MCYDAIAKYTKLREVALLRGDTELLAQLEEKLQWLKKDLPVSYHVLGFARPKLLAFLDSEPLEPYALKWGLVPHWAKDDKMVSNTLNARIEDYRKKPSYRDARRCLIFLDGFFEHHTGANKKKYPFKVFMKDESPMIIGGLWAERKGVKTISIVTTEANDLMAEIHNEAKRMPVILSKENQTEWLQDKDLNPVDSEYLACHPVGQLRGKNAIGNKPEVEQPVVYPDLVF